MYLLKILRVFNGFSALDQSMFMKDIKMLYNKKIEIIIKYNQKLARNYKKDNNNIAKIIFISYLLRASILILNLLCFSYFVGLMWFIICDLKLFEETENFIDFFGVREEFNYKIAIKMTYFAFTSVSTVGLGDYHPRSNSERILGAIFLMSGVSITSYVVENLTKMIGKI